MKNPSKNKKIRSILSYKSILFQPATIGQYGQYTASTVAAIFGGDRRRGRPVGKIRNFEKKSVRKKINTPVPRPRPDFRGGGTPRNFQCLVGFFVGPPGPVAPQLKI